jgi:Tol biopolymer transport system component
MKLTLPIIVYSGISWLLFGHLRDEPDLVITPNTIRIQFLDAPREGKWVIMPGFSELGSPTFSRDGQWIAFDAYKQGFNNSLAECWIARRDGRDLTRLAFGATPRFSPDGKHLLFVRERVNDPKRREGIYIIKRDGSGERWLCEGRWPDWSPDGKNIVFSIGGEETGGARVGATICVAKADGSGREEVAAGDCPSWSPDGSKIAFCRRIPGRPSVIRLYDIQENAETPLGDGWYRANWMADSKAVVVNGPIIGGRQRIVRLSLKPPGEMSELTTEYDEPFSPCCSWDGKEILFIARMPPGSR